MSSARCSRSRLVNAARGLHDTPVSLMQKGVRVNAGMELGISPRWERGLCADPDQSSPTACLVAGSRLSLKVSGLPMVLEFRTFTVNFTL